MNEPLRIALATSQPIPANHLEDCLACRRRLIEADPIIDRLPAYRGEGESDRLLRILDSLNSNEKGDG